MRRIDSTYLNEEEALKRQAAAIRARQRELALRKPEPEVGTVLTWQRSFPTHTQCGPGTRAYTYAAVRVEGDPATTDGAGWHVTGSRDGGYGVAWGQLVDDWLAHADQGTLKVATTLAPFSPVKRAPAKARRR